MTGFKMNNKNGCKKKRPFFLLFGMKVPQLVLIRHK